LDRPSLAAAVCDEASALAAAPEPWARQGRRKVAA